MSMQSVRGGGARARPERGERRGQLMRAGEAHLAVRDVRTRGDGVGLTRALGWFSLALGTFELFAPRKVLRMIGVPEDRARIEATRACGVREITSGLGILKRERPLGYLWSRVGGDVMDLALLSSAARTPDVDRRKLAVATAAVAGVTLLDVLASQRMAQAARAELVGHGARAPLGKGHRHAHVPHALGEAGIERTVRLDLRKGVHVLTAITINRPPDELYRYWRKLENLPRIMSHLEAVTETSDTTSHWRARIAGGPVIEWDAEITKDHANEIIAWRSLPGADVPNGGSVRFREAPGGRGTEVIVELYYQPRGGALARGVAKLFNQVPEVQIAQDLRRFKQVIELGEVVRSDASIHRGMHPARPPARRFAPPPPTQLKEQNGSGYRLAAYGTNVREGGQS